MKPLLSSAFGAVLQEGRRQLCQPCMSNQKQFRSSHQTSCTGFTSAVKTSLVQAMLPLSSLKVYVLWSYDWVGGRVGTVEAFLQLWVQLAWSSKPFRILVSVFLGEALWRSWRGQLMFLGSTTTHIQYVYVVFLFNALPRTISALLIFSHAHAVLLDY